MQVFQYFSTNTNAARKLYGFAFEGEAADLDAFCADLVRDTVVTVTKLITVDDGRGGRLITGRERIIIGAGAIGTIQNANKRHWEAAEEAA